MVQISPSLAIKSSLTATRFRNRAQGCRASRLPWEGEPVAINPEGVAPAATIRRNPFRVGIRHNWFQGCAHAAPWALRHPVGATGIIHAILDG